MKKIIIIVTIICLAVVGWGLRYYFINKNVSRPIVQVYPKGVIVPVGKDFFDRSDDDMDGYTVKVLNASIVSAKDYLKSYNALDQLAALGNFTKYIYVVHVSVGNQNNPYGTQKGIALQRYYLQGTNYILALDPLCYQLANPKMPGASFSLKQNTSMEITLTFDVLTTQTSCKHLLNDPPKLQISQFPHQKLIKLY